MTELKGMTTDEILEGEPEEEIGSEQLLCLDRDLNSRNHGTPAAASGGEKRLPSTIEAIIEGRSW